MRPSKQNVPAAPTSVGAALAAVLATLTLILSPLTVHASCSDTAVADLAITNAQLFGADPNTVTILISGERICAVAREPNPHEALFTINAHDLVVLPGFIDSHVHLFPMGSGPGINSDDALDQFIQNKNPVMSSHKYFYQSLKHPPLHDDINFTMYFPC